MGLWGSTSNNLALIAKFCQVNQENSSVVGIIIH